MAEIEPVAQKGSWRDVNSEILDTLPTHIRGSVLELRPGSTTEHNGVLYRRTPGKLYRFTEWLRFRNPWGRPPTLQSNRSGGRRM